MKFISGFESTHIYGTGKDVLQLTRHTEYFHEDLNLARLSGLSSLRYSAPWHTIEQAPGIYNWQWMDQALSTMRDFNLVPILDPLHHTSFPVWLEGGFANPNFVSVYLRFVTALAERYSWINHYTIINEPFVTTLFCGHEGIWYPYLKGGKNFVGMILNVGEAIYRVSQMLIEKNPDVQLIHVDTCEKHRGLNKRSEANATFRNELRFLVHDLILGKINSEHALYFYLSEHGATDAKLDWFIQNPTRIDVLGLDYYAHSELEWSGKKRIYPNQMPQGFTAIALEYVERFNLPVMLSETNIRGTIYERISWLKFMTEQCELLNGKIEPLEISFEGFCWYPFIDSTDWSSLVRKARGKVDPQGIFRLDADRHARHASELSGIFAALARGEITSREIPAYRFGLPLVKTLRGLLPLMKHWEWQDAKS